MLARLGQALLVGLTLIIVACGNEATAVPAATDAPAAPVATSAPAATTAPRATTVPAATEQPSIPFSSVSAGQEHICGVKTDGSVVCWGDDRERQARPPGGSFASVSAGDGSHTCGVKTDGSVVCWGFPDVAPPDGSFASVSAGRAHPCGVKTDGSVVCWGQDLRGQATPPGG